jgi:osmoprotectant transport system substrate-binding protein
VTALLLAVCISGCGSSSTSSETPTEGPAGTEQRRATDRPGSGRPIVTIGTKNFTEELILGELYSQALQAKGYRVHLKPNIGPSEVVARDMEAGRIDGYPEYTGTIVSVLGHDARRPADARQAYERAAAYERRHGATLLAMAPAEDTDVLVTMPSYAARHRLSSLGDLAGLGSSATLAAAPEFKTRLDGLLGLEQVYGVHHLRFRAVQIGDQYKALKDGRVELAAVFTTDGALSQGGYTLLADPRKIFGFQNVTFAVRRDVLKREGPEFGRTIDMVSAKLSTQALRLMNAAVELDHQSPRPVARQFLAASGLT